jgi:hypothetical protein
MKLKALIVSGIKEEIANCHFRKTSRLVSFFTITYIFLSISLCSPYVYLHIGNIPYSFSPHILSILHPTVLYITALSHICQVLYPLGASYHIKISILKRTPYMASFSIIILLGKNILALFTITTIDLTALFT